MLTTLGRRFGTLRWKLTGTFVLVSLLLAVTLIVVLVGALLWLLSSDLLLREFWNGTQAIAVAIRKDYQNPDRTPELLGEQLRLVAAQNDIVSATPTAEEVANGDVNINFAEGIYFVALLDETGRVITSTAPLEVPNGALLADAERAETQPLIRAALAGEQEPQRLMVWLEPEHQPVAVVPVAADGRVLGAVYTRYSGIPAPNVLFSELPPFIISFLLPWLVVSGGVGMLYSWMAGRGISRRIKRLADASAVLAAGDLHQRVEDHSADEIGQLARQFNSMAEQLEAYVHALRLLAERNAQLAEQAAHLATIEERNRLARDLHDSVSQELFSLTMLAGAARRVLERSPATAAEQLDEIQASAQRALRETRGLIFALRPVALGDRGLAPAIRDLAQAVEERQGTRVQLMISGERHLPLEHEQALFRIVQEALANVARHSDAHEATVTLCYTNERVELEVRDSGCGFDTTQPQRARSVGLTSMTERAEALGGELHIASTIGRGTVVRVVVPAPS